MPSWLAQIPRSPPLLAAERLPVHDCLRGVIGSFGQRRGFPQMRCRAGPYYFTCSYRTGDYESGLGVPRPKGRRVHLTDRGSQRYLIDDHLVVGVGAERRRRCSRAGQECLRYRAIARSTIWRLARLIEFTPEWVSAIGGIAALFAAIGALALQSRELRLQRQELVAQREELAKTAKVQEGMVDTDRRLGYLNFQANLLNMAIEDEELRLVFGRDQTKSDPEWKQGVYITLWLRLNQSQFAYTKGVDEVSARYGIRNLVESDIGRRRWESIAQFWRANAATKEERRFVELVDDEWQQAQGGLTGDA